MAMVEPPWPDGRAPERRSEIDQMMADYAPIALGDQRVESIDGNDVMVIDPRREDSEPTQLAPVLVGTTSFGSSGRIP